MESASGMHGLNCEAGAAPPPTPVVAKIDLLLFVAGTAMPAQLPFFVAACDYTLIGEEFFAASAYLSGEPQQLGSLKGQDVGKLLTLVVSIIGCALFTLALMLGHGCYSFFNPALALPLCHFLTLRSPSLFAIHNLTLRCHSVCVNF